MQPPHMQPTHMQHASAPQTLAEAMQLAHQAHQAAQWQSQSQPSAAAAARASPYLRMTPSPGPLLAVLAGDIPDDGVDDDLDLQIAAGSVFDDMAGTLLRDDVYDTAYTTAGMSTGTGYGGEGCGEGGEHELKMTSLLDDRRGDCHQHPNEEVRMAAFLPPPPPPPPPAPAPGGQQQFHPSHPPAYLPFSRGQQQYHYPQPPPPGMMYSPPHAHHQYPAHAPANNHRPTFHQQGQMMSPGPAEVTPRPSIVTFNPTATTLGTSTGTAFPTPYDAPHPYHHQPPPAPPPPLASQEHPPPSPQLRFLESLERSHQSERLLREWDRSMGLKACHSKTMLKAAKSRKQIRRSMGNEFGGQLSSLVYLQQRRLSDCTTDSSGRRGSMVGSYDRRGSIATDHPHAPPGYPYMASAPYATMDLASACCVASDEEKGNSDSPLRRASMGGDGAGNETFQEQIEKNSQTATMA